MVQPKLGLFLSWDGISNVNPELPRHSCCNGNCHLSYVILLLVIHCVHMVANFGYVMFSLISSVLRYYLQIFKVLFVRWEILRLISLLDNSFFPFCFCQKDS